MAKKKPQPIYRSKGNIKPFKEVFLDYKTDAKEVKESYLKLLQDTKFKNDPILTKLADFVLNSDLENGVKFLKKSLKKDKFKIEEISLKKAKMRLKKGKKLIQKGKTKKKILVPKGFSGRDYFYQLIILQHKYKLLRSGKRISRKSKKKILELSLSLVVIGIKANLPHHLTENLYNRYRLGLEELVKK